MIKKSILGTATILLAFLLGLKGMYSNTHNFELSKAATITIGTATAILLAAALALLKVRKAVSHALFFISVESTLFLIYCYYQPKCEPCLPCEDCPPCLSNEQITTFWLAFSACTAYLIWKTTAKKTSHEN
ncbi:hypothetical protein [Flavobacterium sp. SM2513]|uniref:hypothetical protein n=1 Tax=Flavobacterium sp. SM2513 TaxID=3424766 RepID=UPI003D7F2151